MKSFSIFVYKGVVHVMVAGAPVYKTFISAQEVDTAGMVLVNDNMVVMQVSHTFFGLQFEHAASGIVTPANVSPSSARAAKGNSRKVAIVEAFMVAWSVTLPVVLNFNCYFDRTSEWKKTWRSNFFL